MIKIEKGVAPPSLTKVSVSKNSENSLLYLSERSNYDNGTKAFTFTGAYRTKAVKIALTNAQHGKCCFSEAKFVNDDAHVEHFRPKGRVDEWPSGPSTYPGYYWLAYEWSNLLLCKSTTNSSNKRNFFPLKDNTKRNRSHLDIHSEENVLINPAIEDPRLHIRFEAEEIKGITARGKDNVTLLNLRNPQLDEARRTKYRILKELKDAVDLLVDHAGYLPSSPEVTKMIATLKYSITPQAEFSSMAIDLLTGWRHI